MHLTTVSDYTLRVHIYLALEPTRLATIPAIAGAYGISENHVRKVVHQLSRSGVVETVRGKGGGMRQARPANEIRLGDIVRNSEGAAAVVECLGEKRENCCIARDCALSGILVRAFDSLYRTLDEYTLADLVGNSAMTLKVA